MFLSKVTRNYQITIPSGIRRALHIKVGSLVDFIVDKKQVVLRPKVIVDGDQSWFWSKEWQEAEKEVEHAKKRKDSISFKNVQEMKKYFEK